MRPRSEGHVLPEADVLISIDSDTGCDVMWACAHRHGHTSAGITPEDIYRLSMIELKDVNIIFKLMKS